MIVSSSMLSDQLREYGDPAGKIMRMRNEGKIIPLVRGLYETDRNAPGQCLAGAIYGPSYLSFDYALSVYGLIPEAVYTYTSATFGKKKRKEYVNEFGRYSYRDIPSDAYPLEIVIKDEGGYSYLMATQEKALCDKLYSMPAVASVKGLEQMLFEDLRIDEEGFSKLNKESIFQIGDRYHCNNLNYFIRYLKRRYR